MQLDKNTIEKLAEHVENGELKRTAISKITNDYPDMDWEDAYAIQDVIQRRKEARGNKVVGLKMGLTSFAKMKQMGVEEAIYGFLVDYFSVAEGGEVATGELIHPRVEAEIAVVTKTALKGPNCDIATVMDAIDFVVPAIEIIDSRYENFNFDLKSVIADNTSAARFVIGGRSSDVANLDLPTLGVVLEKNGEVCETGAGAAVLGDPAASVAMLANMLSRSGREIPAGTLILTGGITAAVPVEAGDHVSARFADIGTVNVSFT